MANKIVNEYEPDFVSSPGETLLETIEYLGISQVDLAIRTGRPSKTINEIIKGKTAITTETALQLERALGVPASFWMNSQRHYDEHAMRVAEKEQLERNTRWMTLFPVSAMIKMRWITKYTDKVSQLRELLNFFGVASPDAWNKYQSKYKELHRKSYKYEVDQYALAAWLRRGELLAQQIECKPYDRERFKDTLRKIRRLTLENSDIFREELYKLCLESGVIFLIVPELPKIRVSGVAHWLTMDKADKAVIQLSLRHKTDDHFWFSFFHESAHILQEFKKGVFVDESRKREYEEDLERKADEFASEMLVPAVALTKFIKNADFSKKAISAFANQIGVSPGIVVGQLQHFGCLPYSHCNELKRILEWK